MKEGNINITEDINFRQKPRKQSLFVTGYRLSSVWKFIDAPAKPPKPAKLPDGIGAAKGQINGDFELKSCVL
jgi:hypothetical protein